MRNDLLFIDGELVDLDDSTRITLKYVSNIFTDLSKIVSNNSYTIKLPNTVRNQRIIDHADLPACDTDYQRRVHKARYFRNGVEILSNAQAVLMSVGDTIEIALSWGNIVNFANIVNGGKKLTDLTQGTTENVDWAIWKNWGQNSALFPRVNYGFNDGEPNAWYHPCVTAQRVIGDILYENDVIFDVPDDAFNLLDKIIVPLLTKNDSQDLYDKYPLPINLTGTWFDRFYHNVIFANGGDSTQLKFGEVTGNNNTDFKFNWDTDVSIEGTVSFNIISSSMKPSDYPLIFEMWGDHESLYKSTNYPVITVISTGRVKVVYKLNEKISIKAGYTIRLYLKLIWYTDQTYVSIVDSPKLNVSIGKRGEIAFGEKFPFIPNLPDMKQIDFIKGIMSMLGLFAIPQENNKIKSLFKFSSIIILLLQV